MPKKPLKRSLILLSSQMKDAKNLKIMALQRSFTRQISKQAFAIIVRLHVSIFRLHNPSVYLLPCRHLLVPCQQWKHQKKNLMLKIKTADRRQSPRSGVFIVNFEQISHFDRAFPLLTLKQ